MGVIPAGTLLKTEFNAVIPEETAEQKTLVSKGLDPNFYESSICIIEWILYMVGLGTCPLYRVSDACKSEGNLYRWFIHVLFAQAGLPNTSFKLPLHGPPFIHPYLEILTFLLRATSCPFNFTTRFYNSLDLFFLFSRIICAFASFNFSPFSFYTLCNSCKIYTQIVWHWHCIRLCRLHIVWSSHALQIVASHLHIL